MIHSNVLFNCLARASYSHVIFAPICHCRLNHCKKPDERRPFFRCIMLFEISQSVIFSPPDGTLRRAQDDTDVIKLPLPASRLLEELLMHHGEICEREFLLTEVWDRQGLTGSNGNLNHYISVLRKHFSELDVDDVIETIPRVGFRFSRNISLQEIETVARPVQKVPVTSPAGYRKEAAIICAVMIPSLFIFTLLFLFRDPPVHPVHLLKANSASCDITYLSPFSRSETEAINATVLKKLQEKNILCDRDKMIYFDHYASVSMRDFGRSLIAVCQKGQQKEVERCDNIYYFNLKADGTQ